MILTLTNDNGGVLDSWEIGKDDNYDEEIFYALMKALGEKNITAMKIKETLDKLEA